MFDFDVNKECDEHGNYLIHIATKQGISQMPLLKLLKDICLANVDLQNKDGYTALMIASTSGSAILVDTLLCVLGADPDVRHPNTGRTSLHYACQKNDLDIASTLLKRGADYNIEDTDGARPDDLAVIFRASDCQKVIEIRREERMLKLTTQLLTDDVSVADLRPTDLFAVDLDGYTLIMLAARHNCQGILGWLCAQKDAPINAQHSQTLKTALSYAAKHGHVEAVDILLRNGANPAIKDMNGYMPLHNAAIHHQTAVVSALLKYPQVLTGLYTALQLSRHPVIQRDLQNAMHSRQRSIVLPVLFECCVSGDAEKLYRVLEEGDNVNQMSGLGDWPIYLAAENGHLEVVKLLYELGGDLERRHQQTGNSVLHAASSHGHVEVTQYILQQCRHGSSQTEPCGMVNALNYSKETPLMRAAYKGSFRLVQLLLEYGASPFVLCPHTGQLFSCDFEGLQYVIDNHRQQHADEVLSALKDWKPVKKLKQIFLPQFDHNIRSPSGDTPLMVACRMGKLDVVKFLLESAVFNIFPSPPSNNKLSMLCYDSDADSGLPDVASCKTYPTRPKDLPIRTSSPHDHIRGNGQTHLTKPDKDVEYNVEKETEINTEQAQAAPVDSVTPSASFYIPPDTEAEEECAVRDNISTLLDSIASLSRASVFVNHKRVSHVCAINSHDGRTAFHRVVESGDSVSIITALLEQDNSAINIQDSTGLSPLHLACKLGRKKITEKLVVEPFVDLNCRTLDGKLPEEMSTTKSVVSLVQKARKNQPISTSFSPFRSLPSSIFGVSTSQYSEDIDGSIDFDTLNTRFMLLKHDLGSDVNMFL